MGNPETGDHSNRALWLGGALLLGTISLAAFQSQRPQARYTPPGWSISLIPPRGFRPFNARILAGEAIAYRLGRGNDMRATIFVNHHPAGAGDTPADIAWAACVAISLGRDPVDHLLKDIELGPYIGAEASALGKTGQTTRIVRAIISSDMEAYVFILGIEGNPGNAASARTRFEDFTRSIRPVEGFMIAEPVE